jgi:2,3,4,5-tetrahydropyridine-2,6-dicarboxylate N-succinyltransferase
MTIEERIRNLCDAEKPARSNEASELLAEFRYELNVGNIRVAEPFGEHWKVNLWVKRGLLLHLTLGLLQDVSPQGDGSSFDLDTFPSRKFSRDEGVRVPLGCRIRDGSYLARGVTCMPPVFVNMGVHIDTGTVLDSHVMIGLCSQIGARVHVGPGTQIGGVISPIQALPTIIGDDAVIGGNCGLYDGVVVGRGAVLAPGLTLSGQSRVYDIPKSVVYARSANQPLIIPAYAIVVPGACRLRTGPRVDAGLTVQVAVIAGYKDDPQTGSNLMERLLGAFPS